MTIIIPKDSEWLINPLNKLSNALALIPPVKSTNNSRLTGYKLYSAIISLTIILASLPSLYGRLIIAFPQLCADTVMSIDILSTIVLTTLTCTAILRSSFKNISKYELIIQLLTEIDEELDWNDTKCKNKEVSYIIFIVIHLWNFFLLLFDMVMSVRANQNLLFACYIMEKVMLYYSFIIVALIHSYTAALRSRLEFANTSLGSILQRKLGDTHNERNTNMKTIVEMWKEVYKIRKIFNRTSKLIEIFNAVFGWEILILTIYVSSGILYAVNFVIVSYLNEKRFREEQSITQQEILWYAILWCSTTMVMGTVIAVTCDMTTKEAQRTATVCYNLLLDVPTVSTNIDDRILREELTLLAQQATHQCPYFSAAGFFRVDYTVLFGLLATVMGVVVAVTCDMTTKEAQRTATICYNLLLEVSAVSNNIHDRILREELNLLAQQATHQCPYFSAAGFFRVDYTMLFGLLGTVMVVVIAATCDATTKEAQRTAKVCYSLLLDVPAFSNNIQDQILREELSLLAQHATHQCPYFSAAGFFRVDYSMLFGLLATVTTYIIVLIQIND
ncbi:hypothetical protein ILUMI_12313 [Ignelater luminosus]|uniref:Gustatory receptor n=1 Tax=Ignelater luminosus TaxID=2038154 RepID=A0A8K0CYP4_IGNLU|nr:hypothetical protein ILUMI_12313 [Ignelater luminosus]